RRRLHPHLVPQPQAEQRISRTRCNAPPGHPGRGLRHGTRPGKLGDFKRRGTRTPPPLAPPRIRAPRNPAAVESPLRIVVNPLSCIGGSTALCAFASAPLWRNLIRRSWRPRFHRENPPINHRIRGWGYVGTTLKFAGALSNHH